MAGVNRAAGYTDVSSSSTPVWIPEVYSGKLVEKFYETTVFGEIASTEYEGDIQGLGDNIIIRTVPDVTVSNYSIGSTFDHSDYEMPTSAAVELPIDKAKKFMTRLNTVDRTQSDLDMASIFADEASMKLKIAQDTDMLGSIYADADSANAGTTAGAISGDINLGVLGTSLDVNSSNAIDVLLDVGQAMDEQNIPDTGRWIVLPSWYVRKLKASDLKDASLAGDGQSILRNGKVGMIDRFMIYQSNLLSLDANDDSNIIAGHSAGLAWASQIVEVEKLQNPWDFGELCRGLCVYGYKVIEGKYIFHVVAETAAEA